MTDDEQDGMFGNPQVCAISYRFCQMRTTWPDKRCTELRFYVGGLNLLGFHRGNRSMTLCWDLDEATEWLGAFALRSADDPFPFSVSGSNALELMERAREYDSDDAKEFDRHFDVLAEWIRGHSWHHCSAGGIMSSLFFRYVDDDVEISWDNEDQDGIPDGVTFDCDYGSARVPADEFRSVVARFVAAYRLHWAQVDARQGGGRGGSSSKPQSEGRSA